MGLWWGKGLTRKPRTFVFRSLGENTYVLGLAFIKNPLNRNGFYFGEL